MRGFWKKSQGVITVMLVIVLVPMLTCGTVLTEIGRYRSTKALLEQISSNALLSSLAGFDNKLYENYGIYGVKDEQDETVQSYISKNLNADADSFSKVLSNSPVVSVEEFGPLNSVPSLKFQLVEYEKLRAPTDAAIQLLNIDELLKDLKETLESLVPGLNFLKSIIDHATRLGKLAEATKELNDASEKWNAAIETYQTEHTAFVSAMNALRNYYLSGYDESTQTFTITDQDRLDLMEKYARDALAAYKTAAEDVKTKGEAFIDKIDNMIKTCIDEAGNILNDEAEKDYKQRHKEIKDKYSDTFTEDTFKGIEKGLEEEKKDEKNLNDAVTELAKNPEKFVAEVEKTAFDNRIKSIIESLDKIVIADKPENLMTSSFFKATMWDENDNPIAYSIIDEFGSTSFQLPDSKGRTQSYVIYRSSSELLSVNIWDTLEAIMNIQFVSFDGAIGYIKVMVNLVNNLKDMTGSANSSLNANVNINVAVYDSYLNADDTAYVNQLLAETEATANALGYDTGHMSPGVRAANADNVVAIEEALSTLITSISTLARCLSNIVDAVLNVKWWQLFTGELWQNINGVINSVRDIIRSLKTLSQSGVSDIFTTLVHSTYEGALINHYVIDKFTSRQDLGITEGVETFDQLKVSFANRLTVGLVGEALVTRDETAFDKCEVEYVCSGRSSELHNQKYVHDFIFFVRIVSNLAACLLSDEVGEIAAAANVFAPAVYAIWTAAETYVDLAALQGMAIEIPLIKTQLFLSTKGVTDMLKAAGTNIADFKISFNAETLLKNGWTIITKTMSKGTKGFFKMDYEGYCWVLLCVVGTNTKVERVANLIQMNMMKKDENFRLSDYKTGLRASIDYEYDTMMPMLGLERLMTGHVLRYATY